MFKNSLNRLFLQAKSLGEKTFNSPENPCLRCGGTMRYTHKNYQCVACRLEKYSKKPKNVKIKIIKKKRGHIEVFEGVACKKCGRSLRYKCNHNCVFCQTERNKYNPSIPSLEKRKEQIIKNAEIRTKQKGLEFNIKKEDLEWPEFCPIFGFKLNYFVSKNKLYSASLDRVKNNLGYIKGNVKIISFKANALKSNGTIDDFEKIIQYMKS